MDRNQKPVDPVEAKRLAARRRFLRGAGGSAALVVTVVHKRAFATTGFGKKGAVVSTCVSLQGVPDLRRTDHKKALELSQFGEAPKNVVCRPRDAPPPSCPAERETSRYYNASGQQVKFLDPKYLKEGCGTLEETILKSRNYRLYEKGWCPIKYEFGTLSYDSTAQYFKFVKVNNQNVLQPFTCGLPD